MSSPATHSIVPVVPTLGLVQFVDHEYNNQVTSKLIVVNTLGSPIGMLI